MPLELKARLSLDNRPFTQGMNFSKQQVAAWSKVMEDHTRKQAEKAKSMWRGIGQAAVAATVAIGAAFKHSTDAAGDIQDASDKLGVSAEKLQQWELAAKQSGASLDDIGTGIQKMAVNSETALDGNNELADSFNRLSLSMDDLENLTLEQRFQKLGMFIKDATVDGQLLADVLKTLGKGGANLIPTFKNESFSQKGFVNTDKEISRLDEMGDVMTRIGSKFMAKLRGVFASQAVVDLFNVATGSEIGKQSMSPEEKTALAKARADQDTESEKKKAQEIRENVAQEEAERAANEKKLLEDVTKSGRDLAFSRLKTDKQRKEFLQRELDSLSKEAGNFSSPRARERAFQAAAEANKKQQEIEEIDRKAMQGENQLDSSLTPSDSLRSIGNFLGSRDDRPLTELREIHRVLQAIERKKVEITI